MRRLFLLLSAAYLAGAILIACNRPPKQNDQATVSQQQQASQDPEPAEENYPLAENESYRVFSYAAPNGDSDYNIVRVETSKPDLRGFTINGSFLSFEALTDKHLILSEGTGATGALQIYSLETGQCVLTPGYPIFNGIECKIDSGGSLLYFTTMTDAPAMHWDQEKAQWIANRPIPDSLQNDDLKECQKRCEKNLFDGCPIELFMGVSVNLQTLQATPLNLYRWNRTE